MELKANCMPTCVSWKVGPVSVSVTAKAIKLDAWSSGASDFWERNPLPIYDLIEVLMIAKEMHLDMQALQDTAPKEEEHDA